jgi:hypothetical protein
MTRVIHLLLIYLIFLSLPLSAAIVDRHAIAEPTSGLVDAGGGEVVASEAGFFLVHGQRVNSAGVNLDSEQIPGTEGLAVGWPDGWMIASFSDDRIRFRHLSTGGVLTERLSVEPYGNLMGAASSQGRMAVVELAQGMWPPPLFVTVTDGERVVQRRKLGNVEGGAIAPFLDGFIVASHVRSSQHEWTVHVWRVDRDGNPIAFADAGRVNFQPQLELETNGDRSLLVVDSFMKPFVRVIDPNLQMSAPIEIVAAPANAIFIEPIAVGTGFAVSYQLDNGASRTLRIRRDGTLTSDRAADPILSVDRLVDRYFVLRPWGDGALATPDPEIIAGPAIRFKERIFANYNANETVVSGDVTLVRFGNFGLREIVLLDAAGGVIGEVEPTFGARHAKITPTPQGFAFVWAEANEIRMQRLDRQGRWLDAAHRVLASVAELRSLGAHADGDDLLVAWVGFRTLNWSRFALDGTQLDAVRSVPSVVHETGAITEVSGGPRGRLIAAQQTFQCNITCVTPDLLVEVQAVDEGGNARGPLRTYTSGSSYAKAVGLADGTWLLPIEIQATRLLHLNADATLISDQREPLLDFLEQIEASAVRWRAVANYPYRLVEFDGMTARSVTGLSGVEFPRIGYGDIVTFGQPAPERGRGVVVPSAGRLVTVPGDLAVHGAEINGDGVYRRFDITVKNNGTVPATSVSVFGSHPTWNDILFNLTGKGVVDLGTLPAGAEVRFRAHVVRSGQIGRRIWVLSDDIEDLPPRNNSWEIPPAAPFEPKRGRTVRR